MQGVEKSMISCLVSIFLLQIQQKISMQVFYLILKMNVQNERERSLMHEFARTSVHDFVEEDSSQFESEFDAKDPFRSSRDKADNSEGEYASDKNFDSETREIEVFVVISLRESI